MLKKLGVIVLLLLAFLLITGKVLVETTGPKLPDNAEEIVTEVMNSEVPDFRLGISDTVHADGRAIWYESIGNASDPTIVMIMGLATSGVNWPEFIVRPLVDAGYNVIRFDHRDVGQSGWVQEWSAENPYNLEDMAKDVMAIIDKVGKDKVHVIGISMGGMLAQRVALSYGDRVESLTLFSTSGYMFDPELTSLSSDIMWQMARLELKYDKESLKDNLMRRLEIITIIRNEGPVSEEVARLVCQRILFSINGPGNTNRQVVERHIEAIKNSGSRLDELQKLEIPTLVFHGTNDPLVLPEHGVKCASVIPNAKLIWLDGMGHMITEKYASEILDKLTGHLATPG